MTTPKLASRSSAEAATTASAAAQALWLELLQQVTARTAHELKGALNGVALNLEVVRSRSGHADAPASRVASFADSASSQLEAVIGMTEALLALARPVSGPPSVVRELRSLGALLAPAAGVAGTPLELHLPADGSGETAVAATELRAVLAASLLAALGTGAGVAVHLGGAEALDLSLACEGSAPSLDPRAAALAAAAGVRVRHDGSTLILTFPPPRKGPMPEIV